MGEQCVYKKLSNKFNLTPLLYFCFCFCRCCNENNHLKNLGKILCKNNNNKNKNNNRKFAETRTLQQTVDEAITVMKSFDTNSDDSLDRDEFALFVVKFASALGADLHEMVDFMIVASALKDNSEEEKKYIKSLTASDIYYWGL